MEKLKSQFATVSKLLFSAETRQTYSQAIALTWSIIREVLSLSWLLFCSIFLIFFWGGNYARQAGQNVRTWYSDMDEDQKKNIVGAAAGTLKESIGGSMNDSPSLSLVEIAKSQLDIKSDPPALKALPSAPRVEKQPEETEFVEKQPEETEFVEDTTVVSKLEDKSVKKNENPLED